MKTCCKKWDGTVLMGSYSTWHIVMQVDSSRTRFSIHQAGPLDMRFDDHATFAPAICSTIGARKRLLPSSGTNGEEPKAHAIAKLSAPPVPCIPTPNWHNWSSRYGWTKIQDSSCHAHFSGNTDRCESRVVCAGKGDQSGDHPIMCRRKDCSNFFPFSTKIDRKDISNENRVYCICPPEQPVCTCQHKASLAILTKKPVTASDKRLE